MDQGWHTYWRNPGDSGLPTRVKWTLPHGFEAGEIRWPYPMQFKTGPLVSYGYENEVLLPVEIRVSPKIDEREVRLGVHVDWLECQDACLPGKADLSLVLPVRPSAVPGAQAAAFAEARGRLPAIDPGWRFTATSSGPSITLAIACPRGLALQDGYFYATTLRLLDYAKPHTLERDKTGYRLVLARDPNGAPSERLAGTFVAGTAGGKRAFEVDAKIGESSTRRP